MFGIFIERWSDCIIIPISKKGNKPDPVNYRGISLIDVFSEVYIAIITRRLTLF